MYKVMIVDDEVLVRVGLKTTIDWEAIGFIIVSEAANGEQAYENYLKYRPDVIITDIKMPKQDGIWLIEKIRREEAEARILVLTCYDEFSFVRKALKAGANDYILKSEIEDEELIRLMLSLKEKMDLQVKEELEKEDRPNPEELRVTVSTELLAKGFEIDEKLLKSLKKMNFPITGTSFAYMSIAVNQESDIQTDSSQAEYAVMNILYEQFNHIGIKHVVVKSHIYMIFLSAPELSEIKMKNIFHSAANGALQYFSISLNAVYSPIFTIIEEAGKVYKEFAEKSQVLFYNLKSNSHIITIDSVHFAEPNVSDLKKLYNKNFIEAIGHENINRVRELLKETGEHFQSNPVFPMIAKIFYSNLMGDFFDSYGIYLTNLDEFETHQSYHYQIERADNLKSIHRLLDEFSEKLIVRLQESRYNNSRFLINQALNFINYHYTEKISLDDVAEELNVSKHYLSSIFKKETGENMSFFINKLRIEKAKQLLLESDIKIKEVFEKVGYSDQQYFSKVFKKITGKTVVEYKEGS